MPNVAQMVVVVSDILMGRCTIGTCLHILRRRGEPGGVKRHGMASHPRDRLPLQHKQDRQATRDKF